LFSISSSLNTAAHPWKKKVTSLPSFLSLPLCLSAGAIRKKKERDKKKKKRKRKDIWF
jgi:hypothetical protein